MKVEKEKRHNAVIMIQLYILEAFHGVEVTGNMAPKTGLRN